MECSLYIFLEIAIGIGGRLHAEGRWASLLRRTVCNGRAGWLGRAGRLRWRKATIRDWRMIPLRRAFIRGARGRKGAFFIGPCFSLLFKRGYAHQNDVLPDLFDAGKRNKEIFSGKKALARQHHPEDATRFKVKG